MYLNLSIIVNIDLAIKEPQSTLIYTASRDRLIKIWNCNYSTKQVIQHKSFIQLDNLAR